MRKWITGFLITVTVPTILFMLGPVAEFSEVSSDIDRLNIPIEQLDQWVSEGEEAIQDIKPNNEARIVWADSTRKTEWAIVYLHGFSASQQEGNPVHETIAKSFGMNLYLARLSGHGIFDEDSFAELTPEKLINSAKRALSIGHLLGEKVILMSCSTGGTYSIYLAAHLPELIDALVMYSPNIALYDTNARLLSGPWGLQIGQALLGKNIRYEENIGTPKEQYTTSIYRVEGLVALQAVLDQTMKPEYFKKITQPLFVGYYYKNEQEQDKVVSVKAMRDFVQTVSTDKELVREVAFPRAGDHVICSGLHSSDYQGVTSETESFFQEVLKIEKTDTRTVFEQSM
jgi:pimeloyl-ACP methyl ester carboxylesterase